MWPGQLTFNVEAVGIGKGMFCPHPPRSLLRSSPVSVYPPFPRLLMPLTDCGVILDSSWVIKIILIWPPPCLCTCNPTWDVFPRLGSVCPYFLYPLLPSFQNAVLLPAFAFGPLPGGSYWVEVWEGEALQIVYSSIFFSELTIASASSP